MTVKALFSPFLKPLALAAVLVVVSSVHGADTTEANIIQDPWAFNLPAYLWLPSVYGDFSAGSFTVQYFSRLFKRTLNSYLKIICIKFLHLQVWRNRRQH